MFFNEVSQMTHIEAPEVLTVPLKGEAQTILLGKLLAMNIGHRGKVYLRGDLGAGKTPKKPT